MSGRYAYGRKCAARGCTSQPNKQRFFRFPRRRTDAEAARYHIWADFSGSTTHMEFLCALHFDEHQFQDSDKLLLVRGAIPTIKAVNVGAVPLSEVSAERTSTDKTETPLLSQCAIRELQDDSEYFPEGNVEMLQDQPLSYANDSDHAYSKTLDIPCVTPCANEISAPADDSEHFPGGNVEMLQDQPLSYSNDSDHTYSKTVDIPFVTPCGNEISAPADDSEHFPGGNVEMLQDQPLSYSNDIDHTYSKTLDIPCVTPCGNEISAPADDSEHFPGGNVEMLQDQPLSYSNDIDHTYSKTLDIPCVTPCSNEISAPAVTDIENSSPVMLDNACVVSSSMSEFKPVRLFSGLSTCNNETSATSACKQKFSQGQKARGRSKIMKLLEFSADTEISPKKRKLIQLVAKKERSLRRLKNKCDQNMSLSELCTPGNDVVKIVAELSKSMSVASANFLASQVLCSKRKPKGRRWQLSDKVMALAFYKRSPRCYSLLSTMFALPSKKTLINMMAKIIFEPGINAHIFESLKKTVAGMDKFERTCLLAFDEMSLRQHLEYSRRSDKVVGFEDLGSLGISEKIGNHALVFLVKGIFKKWKQPVPFYITTGSLGSDKLVKLLLSVLEACKNIDLNVVTTVCDMGSNNTRALKLLGATEEKPYFTFGDSSVITLFDSPHLLKCLRNTLFKHRIHLKIKIGGNDVDCVASWLVICEAYAVDRSQAIFRLMHKLTDNHMEPKGRLAMKVSLAAQILSHTVAAAINSFVSAGSLDSTALGTAHFTHFCNKLLDSVNGTSARPQGADGVRCQLRKEREAMHLKFWDEAIREMRLWKVEKSACHEGKVSGNNAKYFRPPCLSGWITTLEGMKLLWKRLKDLGLSYLQPRCINQDSLEHLFGSIRSNCGSNVNPTVPQFIAALKTSMVNGLAFVDVKRSNCEEEHETGKLLNDLHNLVATPSNATSSSSSSTINNMKLPSILEEDTYLFDIGTGTFSLAYVCGSIARRVLSGSMCADCKLALLSSTPDVSIHSGIIFREFSEKNAALTYPSEAMIRCVGAIVEILENVIPQVAHKNCVRYNLLSAVNKKLNSDWLVTVCSLHNGKISEEILNSVISVFIRWWCTRRNIEFKKIYKERADMRKLKILKHE